MPTPEAVIDLVKAWEAGTGRPAASQDIAILARQLDLYADGRLTRRDLISKLDERFSAARRRGVSIRSAAYFDPVFREMRGLVEAPVGVGEPDPFGVDEASSPADPTRVRSMLLELAARMTRPAPASRTARLRRAS